MELIGIGFTKSVFRFLWKLCFKDKYLKIQRTGYVRFSQCSGKKELT